MDDDLYTAYRLRLRDRSNGIRGRYGYEDDGPPLHPDDYDEWCEDMEELDDDDGDGWEDYQQELDLD